MKFRKIFRTVLLLSVAVCFWACGKKEHDEHFDLRMSAESYEVRVGIQTSLSMISGNGNYTIQVEDDDIIEASHGYDGNSTFGSIKVTGKKKGETVLSVTDNVTQQTVKLKVKVTDFYLPLAVASGNHPALVKYMRIFLIHNDSRDVYFFLEEDNEYNLRQKGTYEFIVEKDGDHTTPYLLLRYASDEKGQFTDAAVAPVVHKFDLTGSDRVIYDLLNSKLGVDWEKTSGARTKSSDISLIYVTMKEVGTEYDIQAYIAYSSWQDYLPEGFLD